jgi:hypothetical protein
MVFLTWFLVSDSINAKKPLHGSGKKYVKIRGNTLIRHQNSRIFAEINVNRNKFRILNLE